MFIYETFKIIREDDNNISLYRTETIDEYIDGGRGKGRGTPTGNTIQKELHKGFYSSFQGALSKMVDILTSETKSCDDAIQLLSLLKNIKLTYEPEPEIQEVA